MFGELRTCGFQSLGPQSNHVEGSRPAWNDKSSRLNVQTLGRYPTKANSREE
jgi:hypothetical protein